MNLSAVLKCLPLFVHGFIFPPVVGGPGPRAEVCLQLDRPRLIYSGYGRFIVFMWNTRR